MVNSLEEALSKIMIKHKLMNNLHLLLKRYSAMRFVYNNNVIENVCPSGLYIHS